MLPRGNQENGMRIGHFWRRPWTARNLLLASGVALTALTGAVQLAGPAQAVPSRWSVTPTPNRGTGTDQLLAVSCPSRSFCMAAGTYGGDNATLASDWNGKTWSITPTPSRGASPIELDGVSCTSASFCVAVGLYTPRASLSDTPLVETWNGKTWSITPTPAVSSGSLLYGVSCLSTASCLAVGARGGLSRGTLTLVESWNGKSWSVIQSPSVSTNSMLASVTCRGAASCVAVGSHDGTFGTVTLVESWNGSKWSVMSSPNPAPQGANWLTGVSCPAATSCVAVGGYGTGALVAHNLAETWNGKQWSVLSMPNRGTRSNELGGVSCTSASSCVAAGFNVYGPSSGPGNGQTLVESWNGSHWAITPSPSGHADNQLYAVACTATASCQAVGYAGKGSLLSDKTLVETGS
jgi:hypothetical protein